MELAGFQHCGFVEFNKWACESLRHNFNPELVHEVDVRTFDFLSIGNVDVVAGGPPCQPFSLGGLAKAHDDARDMFPQAIRAIHDLRPKAFVFENVKGLLRKSFADYFSYIILRLSFPDVCMPDGMSWRQHLELLKKIDFEKYEGLKYNVTYKLVNAVDYGVPQNRERVFIVGFRSDVPVDWKWPKPMRVRRTIADAIGHLASIAEKNRPKDHKIVSGAREYPGHSGSDFASPSKTIKAGAHGVPGGENMIRFPDGSLRYMTVHEAKLIQTFPADYTICGKWGEAMRQIGNAVPVRLAELMGNQIKIALEGVDAAKGKAPVKYPFRRREPEQMRLAIEKRKGYDCRKAGTAKKVRRGE